MSSRSSRPVGLVAVALLAACSGSSKNAAPGSEHRPPAALAGERLRADLGGCRVSAKIARDDALDDTSGLEQDDLVLAALELDAVFGAARPELEACPGAGAGQLLIGFRLEAAGAPGQLSADGDAGDATRSCALEVLGKLDLPRPPSPLRVDCPLAFRLPRAADDPPRISILDTSIRLGDKVVADTSAAGGQVIPGLLDALHELSRAETSDGIPRLVALRAPASARVHLIRRIVRTAQSAGFQVALESEDDGEWSVRYRPAVPALPEIRQLTQAIGERPATFHYRLEVFLSAKAAFIADTAGNSRKVEEFIPGLAAELERTRVLTPASAHRRDLTIGADDSLTYFTLLEALDAATAAGFIDIRLVEPGALESRINNH